MSTAIALSQSAHRFLSELYRCIEEVYEISGFCFGFTILSLLVP